jgi:hypothetical protein
VTVRTGVKLSSAPVGEIHAGDLMEVHQVQRHVDRVSRGSSSTSDFVRVLVTCAGRGVNGACPAPFPPPPCCRCSCVCAPFRRSRTGPRPALRGRPFATLGVPLRHLGRAPSPPWACPFATLGVPLRHLGRVRSSPSLVTAVRWLALRRNSKQNL